MKIIFRRAKQTEHLVFAESKGGSVYIFGDFPVFLFAMSMFSCLGFGVGWEYPLVLWLICGILYLAYRLRRPWEGEKLRKVQAFKVNYR